MIGRDGELEFIGSFVDRAAIEGGALVVTDDRMIPPPAQCAMSERAGSTVTETPGSHAIYVSQPATVAALIGQAAAAVAAG